MSKEDIIDGYCGEKSSKAGLQAGEVESTPRDLDLLLEAVALLTKAGELPYQIEIRLETLKDASE